MWNDLMLTKSIKLTNLKTLFRNSDLLSLSLMLNSALDIREKYFLLSLEEVKFEKK